MLTRQVRPHDRKRHAVLKLVAKAVCAAGLIESAARPDAAGECLIEHPAIEDDIQGPVRRSHLHRTEKVFPMLDDLSQDRVEIGGAVTGEEQPRGRRVAGFAKKEYHFRGLSWLQLHRRLQCATRIEAGAGAAGQRHPCGQGCGHFESAVAAEEFSTIRSPLRLPSGEIRECDSRAEGGIPRIAGEQGAAVRIELSQNERRRGSARSAEHPFRVSRDRKPSRAPRGIANPQAGDLDGIAHGHEHAQVELDITSGELESAVSLSMPRGIRRTRVADGRGRRPPHLAALLIAQVQHFAGSIRDWIVRPGVI